MTEQETVKTEEVAKVNPLERTLDLVVSYASAEELTEKALKNYGKNAKLPGFRKGHVPAAQVRRMYGMQAYDEAINQLVGEAWQKAASESELRIAGYPRIDAAKNEEDKENMHFTAKFEVFPDVQVPDFSAVELKRYVCPVTDAEVEKTIDVMRRQRATYNVVERAAANDDRVKLNFKGKKDGVEFQGGSAEGYVFVLGQGRMLPEFEAAVTGMAGIFLTSMPRPARSLSICWRRASHWSFTRTVGRAKSQALAAASITSALVFVSRRALTSRSRLARISARMASTPPLTPRLAANSSSTSG